MTGPLRERLHGDRGEGAIAVLIGMVLFLFASAAIGGFFVAGIGASALAQANSLRTIALQQEVQTWEETPWSELAELPATPASISADSRTYEVIRRVEYVPETNSYALNIAMARATAPGRTVPDCAGALVDKVDGCLSLTGHVTATADEVAPRTPAGIQIRAEQVSGNGSAVNEVANPGFEEQFASWTVSGKVLAAAQPKPRSQGTTVAAITGVGAVESTAIAVTPGDVLRVDAWANGGLTATGQLELRIVAVGPRLTAPVPVTLDSVAPGTAGWQLLTGAFTVPASAAEVKLIVTTASNCGADCRWLVDDTFLQVTQANVAPNPDFEATAASWALTEGARIVNGVNRVAPGIKRGEITGPGMFASPAPAPVEAGQWVAEVWIAAPTPSSAAGTVEVFATIGGKAVPIASTPIAGLGTNWVRLTGVTDLPAGVGTFHVRATGVPASYRLLVDDASIRQQTNAAGLPAGGGYLTFASVDSAEFAGGSQVRVSFQYLPDELPASDLTVGVYCTTDGTTFSINATPMQITQDGAGDGTWVWARVAMPEFDRIRDCSAPQMRIFSPSMVLSSSDVGTISILRVLDGLSKGATS